MDDICRSELTATSTERLNWVRLYLRVETLSDLCTARGTRLDDQFIHWEKAQPRESPKDWPLQAKPCKKSFDAWRSILRKLYCKSSYDDKLRQALGRWDHQHRQSTWAAYYDAEIQMVYLRNNNGWDVHNVEASRHSYLGGRIKQDVFCNEQELPINCIPVHVTTDKRLCDIPNPYFDCPKPLPGPPPAYDFATYVNTLPDWERQLLNNCKEEPQETSLMELLQTTTGIKSLFFGSDGGAYPHGKNKGTGSFGWTIGTEDTVLWRGRGPVIGHPDNSSYRTEAGGALALFRFLYHYMKYYRISFANITSCNRTDSKSLILTIDKLRSYGDKWYSTVYMWNHIDIMQQLYLTMKDFHPLKFDLKKVKGHADRIKDKAELTRAEQINCICDEEATAALLDQTDWGNSYKFYPLPNVMCYLKHQGTFVTSHEKQLLYWARPRQDLKNYYRQRHGWTRAIENSIAWDYMAQATNKIKKPQFIPKLCSAWLPTASVLAKREGIEPTCACKEKEDNDHVILCQRRIAMHVNFKLHLTNSLTALNTKPELREEMINCIWALHEGRTPLPTTNSGRAQQRIGWINLYRGFLAKKWIDEQHHYVASLPQHDKDQHKPKATNKAEWGSAVIAIFLKQAHALWVDRCQTTHAKNEANENQQQRRRAEAKVRAIYKHKDQIARIDRDAIFAASLDDKLKEPAGRLLCWADLVFPTVQQAIKSFKKSEAITQTKILIPAILLQRRNDRQRNIPRTSTSRRRTRRTHRKQTSKHHTTQAPSTQDNEQTTNATTITPRITHTTNDQVDTEADNNHPT